MVTVFVSVQPRVLLTVAVYTVVTAGNGTSGVGDVEVYPAGLEVHEKVANPSFEVAVNLFVPVAPLQIVVSPIAVAVITFMVSVTVDLQPEFTIDSNSTV